jgi:putative oxidoreductase
MLITPLVVVKFQIHSRVWETQTITIWPIWTLGTIVAMLGRIVIGATLIVAGIGKVRNGQSKFLQSILGHDLVPKSIAAFMAHWLPYFEVLAGVMLVVGFLSQVVSIFTFSLFLLFTSAIRLSLVRGMNNDCGWFRHVTPVQWRLVYRDVFLMGLLLPVFAFKGGIIAVDNWLPIQTSLSDPASTQGMIILMSIWGIVFLAAVLVHRFMQKRAAPVKATPF